MVFHSVDFLIFFIVVLGAYYNIPHAKRWLLLLMASYAFYMWWEPIYAILILFSTTIDYFAALNIFREKNYAKKQFWLWLSIIVNLGLLSTFKYFNFFIENIELLFYFTGACVSFPKLNWILPIGISFYTFQTISYTVDVYKRKIEPERHFGIFALYVSFFPQLVAGPIERAAHLIPALKKKIKWDFSQVKYGIIILTWGFFKKLVIADRLGVYVDQVYANPSIFDGGYSLVASYAFAFQVYTDFSAYSDMAVGIAALLGIKLMHNFKQPFFSTSVLDFFSRWHVSFMLWLRDYIYKPLNKKQAYSYYFNLFLVFLISGIWHGAAWTFIIWGAFNGVIIIVGRYFKKIKWFPLIQNRFILWMYTFHIYLIGTILFRASNINDALIMLENIFTGSYKSYNSYFTIIDSNFEMMLAVSSLLILFLIEFLQLKGRAFIYWSEKKELTYHLLLYSLLLSIVLFGWFGGSTFIYFQF